MCLLCGLGVPVCNLAGGCGIEVLDYIKIAGMTGGAGLGIVVTTLKANRKKESIENKKSEKAK